MSNISSDAKQNQPTINIGLVGHVANGKSTIVKAITNIATQRHSNEQSRGITINIGYANAKIFKCNVCNSPECYQSTGSDIINHQCNICDEETILVSHISFVDNPGHYSFMTTMMNGTNVMDYAILVESAENMLNKNCKQFPAPQTIEHLNITEKVNIPTKIICINKFDLVQKQHSAKLINTLKDYLDTTSVDKSIPIIPISASLQCNIDVICESIAQLEPPKRDLSNIFKMIIVRSFNVNKHHCKINDIKGGIIGGTLIKGIIKINSDVIIYPGYITEGENTKWKYSPLISKILSISSDKNELEYAIPGGLIGVQLDIDSALTCDNKLVGQVLVSDKLENIKIYEKITIKCENILNVEIKNKISLNINSNNILCIIEKQENNCIYLDLEKPVFVELGDNAILSTILSDSKFELLGKGSIIDGKECEKFTE